MYKALSYITVGLTIIATLCTSCSGSGETAKTAAFGCDECFRPVIEEQCELFLHRYDQYHLDSVYADQTTVINKLLDGEIYMAITSRDFKEEEIEYLKGIYRAKPFSYRIAYDGFALIQNNENSDSCITVKDIKRILSGEVTEWKEIFPESKLGKITLVFDNANSSTVHFAQDSLLNGKKVSDKNAYAAKNTTDVMKYVQEHKSALGIIGSNWLNDQRDSLHITFRKEVRPMYVTRAEVATIYNSYQPFQAYFATGDYPLTRAIWLLLNDPQRGAATMFKNYIISQNQGQLLFLKDGFLPAYGNVTFREINVSR